MPRVLITGAAGGVGRFLCAGLPALGWTVRAMDLHRDEQPPAEVPGLAPSAPADAPAEVEWLVGDVRDPDALDAAFAGVDAVVHLAGISVEDTFPAVLSSNIDGSWHLFEAARRAGVHRIVYASSNHAVGFADRAELPPGGLLPVETPLRPDSYYGLSKVFGEGLCSLYADKFGMDVVVLRIGSWFARPRTLRMLATWLSPADGVRLCHAALTAPGVGLHVAYGASANTRGWWDLASARALGWEPQEDSEVFAAELEAAHGGPLAEDDPEYRHPGGAWTRAELTPER